MNKADLISGLKFAVKYSLPKREIELLLCFLEKDMTALESRDELGLKNITTMHHMIGRLRLKNLLILKDVDANGKQTYQVNPDVLVN